MPGSDILREGRLGAVRQSILDFGLAILDGVRQPINPFWIGDFGWSQVVLKG